MDKLLTIQEQQREIARNRVTDLEVSKVRQSARGLYELRRSTRGAEFERIAQEKYPDFIKKYPLFFAAIEKEDVNRIDESLEVMDKLLNRLESVQQGKMNHEQLHNSLFETELARKYHKFRS